MAEKYYRQSRAENKENFKGLPKQEYSTISDDNYYKRSANGSNFSKAGYVFSRNSSYLQFRKYLLSPVQNYLTSVSGSNSENHALLEYLNKKIEIQLEREKEFVNSAASFFIEPTGNLENDKNEILKVFRGKSIKSNPDKILKSVNAQRFAAYLGNRYYNQSDKDEFDKMNISDKKKKEYDHVIELINQGKYVDPQHFSTIYQNFFAMIKNTPTIYTYLNQSSGALSFMLQGGKGLLYEMIAGLQFLENIKRAVKPEIFEKAAINLVGSQLSTISNTKPGTSFQSKIQLGSITNPKGQGTTDVIVKLPNGKPITIDVKSTKGGYGATTREYSFQTLLKEKSKALTDEDRLLFKQLAYLIINTIHITGDVDVTDQLLSPLLTLLFTTNDFLNKLLPTSKKEINKSPYIVAYRNNFFWFSFLLESIISTYFGTNSSTLISRYTLTIKVNQSDIISSEDFIKLKSKTVKNKYSEINYVDRLESLLTDPTLEPHFAAFQSMVNSISIKAYSSIKLKDK